MKTTTDIQDAHMTLATIAYEHDVPYNTVNTASDIMDWFDVPPDIYVLDRPDKDPAIELIYEMADHKAHLKITVREKAINIIDNMNPRHTDYKYMATIQDCIDYYKKYQDVLKEQFSFYEESF